MQLILGLTLIFAAIPYAMYALMNGVREPYMGIVALVVSGGVLVARAIKQRRMQQRPRPVIVPPPALTPAIPPAPRLPSIPPIPADDDAALAPPPVPEPTTPRREKETILPPKKAEQVLAERGHLRLVHSDGRPCDVRAPGKRNIAK